MSDNENNPAVPPKVSPDAGAKLNATVRIQPEQLAKLNATVRIDSVDAGGKPAGIRKPGLPGAKAPSMPSLSVGGAHATTPAAAIEAAKKLTGSLKSVTGPIPVQAVLHKTGIIAEGLPTDNQAAKSKTSRISLNDAMGVAPTRESAAPLKTIRLKRPTGLPAAPASAAPAAAAAPQLDAEPSASVTQKKTLKLHRPGGVSVKRPSIGIAKPEAEAPASAEGVAELGEVAELDPTATVTATQTAVFQQQIPSNRTAPVPKWLLTLSFISTLAAFIVFGVATFFMVIEGTGPEVNDLGANTTAFIYTAEDHHIDLR